MLYSSLEGRYLLEKVSRKVKICCYSLAKKQLFCETNMGKTYWCQDQIHPYIMIYDTQVRHVCHGFAVSLFRMFSRCGTPINFRYEPQKILPLKNQGPNRVLFVGFFKHHHSGSRTSKFSFYQQLLLIGVFCEETHNIC